MTSSSSLNRLWQLAFWALLLAITWLSLVPVDQLPPSFNFWDKAQHALGFAALGLAGLLAYPQQPRTVLAALLLHGGAIELAQAATGWRFGEWSDWLADGIGLALGSVAWRGVTWALQRLTIASR